MLLILMSASDRSGLRSLVIQHHYNRSSRLSEKLISASAISVRGSASSPVQIVIEDGANNAIACGRTHRWATSRQLYARPAKAVSCR